MSLARRFCVNESDAEELVNATFAKVVDNIDDYLEQSAFFAWMCQILTNLFRESVRRKSNKNEIFSGDVPEVADDGAQEEIFRNLDHSLLRDAIRELPADQRELLLLHYFMDMPVAKIAKFLSIPNGTVFSRLHYARKALADKLGAAAKKPDGRALLLALALCGIAALGATASLAVGRLLLSAPAAQEQQANDGAAATGATGGASDGTGATGGTGGESGGTDLSANQPQQENTLMNTRIMLAPLAALSLAAQAETATFLGTEDQANTSALTKSASWSNGIAPTNSAAADYEYLLEGDNTKFRSPPKGSVTVYANPFRVGTVGGTVGRFRDCNTKKNPLKFANGLVLANGSFYRENSRTEENALDADVTVTAPESAPFEFYGASTTGYGNYIMRGTWASAAGTKILFSSKVSEENPTFGVTFTSPFDLSGFHGTMGVAATESGCGPFRLLMNTATMPGTVEVGAGGIFGTLYAKSVVSVGTLLLEGGARLAIPADADAATNGLICVTESFATTGSVTVDMTNVSSPLAKKTPILTLAPGCEGTLNASSFSLTLDGAEIDTLSSDFMFVVASRTLYLSSCSPTMMVFR